MSLLKIIVEWEQHTAVEQRDLAALLVGDGEDVLELCVPVAQLVAAALLGLDALAARGLLAVLGEVLGVHQIHVFVVRVLGAAATAAGSGGGAAGGASGGRGGVVADVAALDEAVCAGGGGRVGAAAVGALVNAVCGGI
jgi:hypothetical protein